MSEARLINPNEQQYLYLLQDILENGYQKGDRTGTGTLSVFGRQLRFDLSDSFPLLTTKKMFTKGIFHELIWLISGSTNIKYLQAAGVHIWDEWADHNGDLGPVYGQQWREWCGITQGMMGKFHPVYIDQLAEVIARIKTNPDCRRLIVSAWNAPEIPNMALPPCHVLFQFYVAGGKLSCHLYQRSADVFLGVPFNIASYATLTHMVAQVCGLEVGEFIHTFGDVHIYNNHIDQVKEQLTRVPFEGPQLLLSPDIKNIDDFVFNDLTVTGYESHPAIKAEVSV